MAHKKAQWSTSNGRDSNAQRLWVKVYGGQKVIPGNIIVRQKWNKFWPSEWVAQGNDFTLYAQNQGIVRFFEKKRKRYDGRIYVDTYVTVE